MKSTAPRECRLCHSRAGLKACQQCKLVEYCGRDCQLNDWKKGHKILCSKVPKAVRIAEEKIASFDFEQYTMRDVGNFWVTKAVAERGEIVEEQQAQNMCYDAMEMTPQSNEKLLTVVNALKHFPLSTEAWGMLGHCYQYEVTKDCSKKKLCATEALKMYDNAIECAGILNPAWVEEGAEELRGDIELKPFMRALHGRAIALKDMDRTDEAITQAKKIIMLNPRDGQGVRKQLCTWFLEARDTEGCAHLLRKFTGYDDTYLAYSDVLLQYFLWKRGDAGEKDVKKALYSALKENPFVHDVLGCAGVNGMDDEDADGYSGYSPGSMKDAKLYVASSRDLWRSCQECVGWIESQKFYGGRKVPSSEDDLIDLLENGVELRIVCVHTDLKGNDRKGWTLQGTQKRTKCIGHRTSDFKWPRQLNRERVYNQTNSDILVHNNVHGESGWRKTKYSAIQEVPFWGIFLQFWEDDNSLSDGISSVSVGQEAIKPSQYEPTGGLPDCKECDSPARFCALDNARTEFYCSKSCMNEFLDEEIDPPFFDLHAETLEIKAPEECTINVINLDDAFRVAGDHMPNLNSVDIEVCQEYFLKENLNNSKRSVMLTPAVLNQFLEKVKYRLISFVFGLHDCCWEEIKRMTDRCRSLIPLGSMPHIKKLELTHFGFDDVATLKSCLSTSLQCLNLDHVKMGRQLNWSPAESTDVVVKLCQLTRLVSLSISDSFALNDEHLCMLLPNLCNIKCLVIDGPFSTMHGESQVTDVGMHVIAKHCPGILSLSANFQRDVTVNGVRSVIRRCHHIVELEIGEININLQQHLREIVTTPKKLRVLCCGKFGEQSERCIQQAVIASKGRVVVCTMSGGRADVPLSPAHKRNQDQSMDKVERAHKQRFDPLVCQKWEGIL